jgi:hypothetical protein
MRSAGAAMQRNGMPATLSVVSVVTVAVLADAEPVHEGEHADGREADRQLGTRRPSDYLAK